MDNNCQHLDLLRCPRGRDTGTKVYSLFDGEASSIMHATPCHFLFFSRSYINALSDDGYGFKELFPGICIAKIVKVNQI